MEFVDILDLEGNPTDNRATREESHQKGLWHRVAHIWIVNSKEEILIQKRSANKDTYPNMWGLSCEGHISAGQTPIDSALRELKEELNLNIQPNQIILCFTYRRSVKYSKDFIGNHFIDVYLVKSGVEISDLTIQKEEVSEIRWINLSDYINEIKNHNPNFRDYPEELEKLPGLIENKIINKD